MKKKAVKLTEPRRVHIEGPIVGRMAGYKFYLPDETDDVADWAKEASRKINKIFKSTRPQDRAFICKMAEIIEI